MAGQTPVNRMATYMGQSTESFPSKAPFKGARRLGAHAIELGELQMRLFVADVKAASRRLIAFAVLAIIGGVVLLGAMPVVLHALGLYLAEEFGWSPMEGLALAAGLGALTGIVLLIVAVIVVRAGIAKFNRSASEFRQNLTMLKEVVSRSPDPAERSLDI